MRRFLILLTAAGVFSCADHNQPKQILFLSSQAILNKDSVSLFLSRAPAQQADSSRQAFLKGIDLLKNSKKAKEAIRFFEQSLSIYPTANAYYELGNAHLETGTWASALQSFQLAEALDYKPLGHVFFKQASCYARLNDFDKMLLYIRYAVQNGFVDKRKILEDVHFANYKHDNSLLAIYNEAMSGNGDPDEVLWHGYSNDFKQANFPFTADTGTFRKLGEPQIISYDYEKFIPEMRDNKFSREVGNEFFYVARIAQTEFCHVVLYGCRSFEEEGAPDYYILASFNPKGKLIDKMIVGGAQTFDENYKVFNAKNKHQFLIEEYKNMYEKDPAEHGFQDNKLLSRRLVSTKQFLIDSNGKFITAQQS